MALRVRSTTRLTFFRLVPVSICLCVFTMLPVPQFAALASAESTEVESPCKGDGEKSEKELGVWCSAHGRSKIRRHRGPGRPPEKTNRSQLATPTAERAPAIVGHHLANGLRAPLLI